MTIAPPTVFTPTLIRLKRGARKIFWPHPYAYYPFGILRNRVNVFERGMQLYMGGYPRSGNTFSRSAFAAANPEAKIQTHLHIPSAVLHLARSGVPGLVLIRKPLDAAVSWAIHQNQTLEEAVAYWNDYYRTLLPVHSQLFLAAFEDVTTDFGSVIRAFNARFGTDYSPFHHTAENAARCFQYTEDIVRTANGEVPEMQVCRPSRKRRQVKERHLGTMEQSDFLQVELAKANALYKIFMEAHRRPAFEAVAEPVKSFGSVAGELAGA
jgi:hypothetical protein